MFYGYDDMKFRRQMKQWTVNGKKDWLDVLKIYAYSFICTWSHICYGCLDQGLSTSICNLKYTSRELSQMSLVSINLGLQKCKINVFSWLAGC